MGYFTIKMDRAPSPIRIHYANKTVRKVRIRDEPSDVVLVDTDFLGQPVTDRWERRKGLGWVKAK